MGGILARRVALLGCRRMGLAMGSIPEGFDVRRNWCGVCVRRNDV
jgi:hypothetical protein